MTEPTTREQVDQVADEITAQAPPALSLILAATIVHRVTRAALKVTNDADLIAEIGSRSMIAVELITKLSTVIAEMT